MRKGKRRIVCALSALCMMLTLLVVPTGQAAASVAPQKEHIQVKQRDSFIVEFEKGDYKIANLKANNSNLILRTTYVNSFDKESSYETEHPYGYAEIGMYAKKKGTYTVTFDVIGRGNTVRKSHSVKVYATNDYAIKKAEFAGKTEFYGISSKAKGKFKVTMTKGYQLKSISVTTYNKAGKAVTKKVKNGQAITLGKYRSKRIYEQSSKWDDWYADLLAETEITVTYKDKYTREEKTAYYTLFRAPAN